MGKKNYDLYRGLDASLGFEVTIFGKKMVDFNKYYDDVFTKYYGSKERNINLIPYKWMPKFVDADDCSAKTLDIYNSINKRKMKCSNCDGSGNIEDEEGNEIECPECSGKGNNNCEDCNGNGEIDVIFDEICTIIERYK